MNNIDCINQYLLDSIINNLHPADKPPKGSQSTLFERMSVCFGRLKTLANRINYKFFKDFCWHNETEARELLLEYINSKECKEKLKTQHGKILQIYERLAHLSRGKGTWADGIDKELLHANAEESEKAEDEDLQLPELEEMILNDVFIPETEVGPIVEKEGSPQKERAVDPRGQSYVFKRQEGGGLNIPSCQMLFHIHAGEFGSSSEQEGGSAQLALRFLHDFLISRQYPFCSESLIDALNDALGIKSYGDSIAIIQGKERNVKNAQSEIAKAFKTKKPLLIQGGWTGKPSGHGIYYEIIPGSDQKATFRLYNTGAGIDAHRRDVMGHKVKYHAYDEWRGIDRKNLESPLFLEAVYELNSYNTLPLSDKKTEYQEKDVYQGLKALLKPESESVGLHCDDDQALLMTPQRAGVCSWKSLMAFMRAKMELNDYKRFKCDIKLQSLLDFIDMPRNVGIDVWRLVKKSHQNLCRAIVKLYREKLVGDAYIQTAQKELSSIANWIKSHSGCRYKRAPEKIPSTYLPNVLEQIVENKHASNLSLAKLKETKEPASSGIQPWRSTLDHFRQIDRANPKTIDASFDILLAQAKLAWKEGEDLAIHKGLVDFVSDLPMDETFWSQAINCQPKLGKKWITQLGEISQFFMKSCFTIPQGEVIFPEKIYLFYKVLHLQERICRLTHPKWKTLKLFTNDLGDSRFLNFPNAKMQWEMEQILANKEPKNALKIDEYVPNEQYSLPTLELQLLSLFPNHPKGSEKDISLEFRFKKCDSKQSTHKNFQDLIHQEYPEIIAKIAEEESGFKRLPKFSQDARIYASSKLPEWIQAMRDTQLALHHIKKSSVGPLTSLDRSADLVPQFQIEDSFIDSKVTITLKGVNGDILKVPTVNRIKNDDNLRYSSQYRKIASPAIQKLIDLVSNYSQHYINEKVIANSHAKDHQIDMKDEEFKELARLFASSELQHIETLEYFTKYPEKLQDPDYQTLLHILLFQRGLLDESFKIEGFGDHLAHFIQQNFEHLSGENVIQPAVFLLRLGSQLRDFSKNQGFFGQTIENLKALLNRKGLEREDKVLIYAELIAELGSQESLTDDEIALLVTGSIYVEENRLHSRTPPDPFTQKEMSEALLIHANQIRKVLQAGKPNQELLNRILTTLRPDLKDQQAWEMIETPGQFPLFITEDGSHTLYPLISQLVSIGKKALLPANIRDNPLFQQLFPGIEYGSFLKGNLFSFKDTKGRETLVFLKSDHLIIEQKQNGEWVRYVPSSAFLFETTDQEKEQTIKSTVGSRYLAEQYTHWHSQNIKEDGTSVIYVTDPKSGKRLYAFNVKTLEPSVAEEKLNHKYAEEIESCKKSFSEDLFEDTLKRMKQRGEIKDVDPDHSYFEVKEVKNLEHQMRLGKPSLFIAFENPSYIHEWYDLEGNLKKIELPRFNLSFQPSAKNSNLLVSEQFPNYLLNTTDSVKNLGVHHHYLLLEDESKQQKLILAQQNLKSPKTKEVLLPHYELDRCLKREQLDPQKYYVFDIQKNGKLLSQSREANLYLAKILTAAQEYKEAAYYLKKFGDKLSVYTPREAKILEDLASMVQITGDKSGNGTALQLYATLLAFKNALSHHQEISTEELITLQGLYDRYLNLYNSVTVFKLQPEDEKLLLKTFLSKQFNTLHYLRLKELDPVAAERLEIPLSPGSSENKVKTLEGFTVPDRIKGDPCDRKPAPYLLLTRPQKEMQTHFLYFYDVARKGSDHEKERLRASLPFVGEVENGKYAGMANFFKAVLDNPTVFPDPLSMDHFDIKLLNEWKNQLKTLAENELKKKAAKPLSAPRSNVKIPEGFHLGKAEGAPPVNVNLKLPTLTSLADEGRGCFKKLPQENKKGNTCELETLLNSCTSNDLVQKREVNRLNKDLKFYRKASSSSHFSLTEEGLSKVEEVLSKDKTKDRKTLQDLRKEILALANKSPEIPAKVAEQQIKKWGKLCKTITLDELMICFAKRDFGPLLQRNPALVKGDLQQLAEKVGFFLLYATRDAQRERIEETLLKLKTCKPEERDDLVNQLAEKMLANRCFNPEKCPAYLVFEYFANIIMRPAQVDMLKLFLNGSKPNLVIEMIMGSGKSKVLLPLLGLLRADGNTLSMIIVPEPLFESISQDTQRCLQNFSLSLAALHFDRKTKFTKERLEAIYDQLKTIRDERQCLIMTSKSVQCLMIKFVEECSKHIRGSEKREFPLELKLMQNILNLMSESGYPIIDEADTVLNIFHEVNFSGGNPAAPKTHERELLSNIFGLIYSDPKIKALARVESDPNPIEEAPVLTEQLYKSKVQLPLANAAIDLLGKMIFESEHLTKKLHQLVETLNEKTRVDLLHYLCHDQEHTESAQKFFDALDEDVQDIVALAAEEISHLLPHTLTRICDEKYGLDEKTGDPLAIPFSASQTPNSGSQFSNPHITMNYTFQTFMKKGVTTEMVEREVKLLQEKALLELASGSGKRTVKETEAGKVFAKLKKNIEMPFFNYKPQHLEDLRKAINESPETCLFFVSHIVLPQLKQFAYKISCNPQNLVAFFLKKAGFTGTLWNGGSMHHELKPKPAKGTDAKTLTLLFENSRKSAVTIKEGSIEKMLEQLNSQHVTFDMISDAGGYFKEGNNSEMAHKIAQIQGKDVIFYNDKGEQSLTKGADEILLSETNKVPGQHKTFLDQSHTTGADVTQKLDAVSIVTIGRNMLLRDLLQSAWRLRGLDKSQTVRFVVSEEVAGIIRQKLNLHKSHPIQLDAILKFVIINQASQQGRNNYRALKAGLSNILQIILLKVLLNEKLTPEARAHALHHLHATWIKPAVFRSKELYGTLSKKRKSADVVKLEKKKCISKIKEIFEKLPWLEKAGVTEKSCLEEIDRIVSNIKEALPAELEVSHQEIDDDQTTEIEHEMKTETESEMRFEVHESTEVESPYIYDIQQTKGTCECESFADAKKMMKSKNARSYYILDKCKLRTELVYRTPIFPLNSYLESDPSLNFFASAFDGIQLSLNVLEWSVNEMNGQEWTENDQYKILGSRRTDFHHLLVKDQKVTLLSQSEATLYRDHPDYYNLTLGFNDRAKKLTRAERFKIVKIKFLNGESRYTTEELKLLKLWFKTQGVKRMQKLFLDEILKGYPMKIARYQNSSLKKLFAG